MSIVSHPLSFLFQDKSLWIKFKLPLLGEIRFNPIVSLLAIVLIWTFVAICSVYKSEVPFKAWRGWIVDKFTWLYVGSQDVWAVFIIVLYCRCAEKIETVFFMIKLICLSSYRSASTPTSSWASRMTCPSSVIPRGS